MKTSIIRSTWMEGYGYRLDCSPYLGGALETKVLLEKLPLRKDHLRDVTTGIYHAGRESRNWVESEEHGVRFLGAGQLQRTDLSSLPLISKKQVKATPRFIVHKGSTLITRSGTIGNMAYCRSDMDGLAVSEDVLRVIADPAKIPSGYLYAYLSSKFGVPLVVSGTYGAVIQHLEPEHIVSLPVPRLGEALEHEIHSLVEEAADLLSTSSAQLVEATEEFFASVGLKDITKQEWHRDKAADLGFAAQLPGPYSLRSINYAPRFTRLCEQIRSTNWKSLGEICVPGTLSRGGRYTRIDADPEHGYELIGQRELFYLKPSGRWIARNSVGSDVLLESGTIAVAAQGTLGEAEVYCRAQFVSGPWTRFAFSEHILRVVADESKMLRGCLFAFMRSETAFRMLRSIASGSKQQDNHYYFLPRLPIPVPKRAIQEKINAMVLEAIEKRHRAVANEDKAVAIVESTIDSHGR